MSTDPVSLPAAQKSGYVKKRSARLHQWKTRYFILSGSKLSYKLKAESQSIRDTFDLIPGCVVTQVTESKSGISGKKLYSFWLVWPGNENTKVEDGKQHLEAEESDDERETPVPSTHTNTSVVNNEGEEVKGNSATKSRNLQQIAVSEANHLKIQKSHQEKQMEQMEARDGQFSMGTKIAAAAVGGVAVGALTAGVGLVPYVTVVGLSAIAGGGAVAWQLRKPIENRLILACETMEEAIDWKLAIETEISILVEASKPTLHNTIDRKAISAILDRSTAAGVWKRVAINEGIRILEHVLPITILQTARPKFDMELLLNYCSNRCYDLVLNHATLNEFSGENAFSNVPTRCRKSQSVIKATPINVFLTLMDSKKWPKNGSLKVSAAVFV
jgi:hypothetical protein